MSYIPKGWETGTDMSNAFCGQGAYYDGTNCWVPTPGEYANDVVNYIEKTVGWLYLPLTVVGAGALILFTRR